MLRTERGEVSGRRGFAKNTSLNRRHLMATPAVTRRFDLTDARWAILEPLLSVEQRPSRPSTWSKRQLIDGVHRQGAQRGVVARCDRPPRLPAGGPGVVLPPAAQRTWVHPGRPAGPGRCGRVDRPAGERRFHVMRARRRGDLQREPPGGVAAEPADHVLGRSRGGLSTMVS